MLKIKMTKNRAKRFLATMLSAALIVGLIPVSAFAAVKENEIVTAVAAPEQKEYTVADGTVQADIGLPTDLTVTILTPATVERKEGTTREENLAVIWEGHYDGARPGNYALTAKFEDGTTVTEGVEMPIVTVNVEKSVEKPIVRPVEDTSKPLATLPKAALDDLTISNPRLEVEVPPGKEKDFTTKALSSKGYFARISADAADTAGVNNVWIGYRFTVDVPAGVDQSWVRFTDVSYSWLLDLATGTKTAIPIFNSDTHTWTLEGKYLYNEAAPLGSSGAKEYARSISITTSWIDGGVTINPTIETWLVDKAGDTPKKNKGDSITVLNSPTTTTSVSGLNNIMTGLYSPSKKTFYYKKREAAVAGAADAVAGRVYDFISITQTSKTAGNEMIQNNAPVTVDIPLSVNTKDGREGDAHLQPILLGAHYSSAAHSNQNAYAPVGPALDMTYGGRVQDYVAPKHGYINTSMSAVNYTGNTIISTVSAANSDARLRGCEEEVGYYQVFVPVADDDTKATNRTLAVGDIVQQPVTHTGGRLTDILNYYEPKASIKVEPVTNETDDFIGAYSRSFRFGWTSPKVAPVGDRGDGGDIAATSIYTSLVNVKVEPTYDITAFDMLIKLDTDAYVADSSVEFVTSADNKYGSVRYPLKYGVLKAGAGNWGSDDAMNAGRKADLTFYEAGRVPAGAKVAAILIEGRGGSMSKGSTSFILKNVNATTDATKAGKVYQGCLDIETWSDNKNPDKEEPSGRMYADGYKKAAYDADGTYHADNPQHLMGDSLLLLAYTITGESYNLNGTNRPTRNQKNNTTYDVVAGQRTADARHEFTINYLGNAAAENKDQEIQLCFSIPRAKDNAVLDKDSIRLDAVYTPGATEGGAGTIMGGIAPDKIEEAKLGWGLDWYQIYFTVKGSGTHNIYYSVQLGDVMNPDKDVAIGGINYGGMWANASGASTLMVNGNTNGENIFIITKSNAAGFKKTAVSAATSPNGITTYVMNLTAQDQNLTGAMLLDVLPFNGDGRGTRLSGTYTVKGAVKLQTSTANRVVLTDFNIYYTADAAIQTSPVKQAAELKGINFIGDTMPALGVTWHKATRTDAAKDWSYDVPADAKAIVGAGIIGQNEAPVVTVNLQMANMATGDKLMNTAGFDANEFGKAINSSSALVSVAERRIQGTAWVDNNNNGQQDTEEGGLAGLTVKLFQGTTEITTDEQGGRYKVTTDANGAYVFNNVPSSPEEYHVVFSGGTISDYEISKKNKAGVADNKDSDVAKHPATGTMTSAVSDGIYLLTLEQQAKQGIALDTRQLDGGFVPYHTVSFDTDGGIPAAIAEQNILSGNKVTAPGDLTKANAIFGGWYRRGTNDQWNFDEGITEDLDLLAKWLTPKSAAVNMTGTKTLSGGGKTDADIRAGQFTFTVTADPANPAGGVAGVPTGNIDTASGGALNFGTWDFDKEGVYNFIVAENTPPPGYTNGAAVAVTVTVTVNAVTKMFEAVTTYSSGNTLTIANTYTAAAGVGETFEGTKTLTENGANKAMADGQFTVDIAEDAANDTTGYTGFTAGTKDIAADGTFSFDEITFNKAGTYKFAITENNLGAAGYTYDDKAVTAAVAVTLDTTDNTLHTAVTYEKGGVGVTDINFVNTYTNVYTAAPKAAANGTDNSTGTVNKDVSKIVKTVKTSDMTQIPLWIIMFAVAGGTLVGSIIYRHKKKRTG